MGRLLQIFRRRTGKASSRQAHHAYAVQQSVPGVVWPCLLGVIRSNPRQEEHAAHRTIDHGGQVAVAGSSSLEASDDLISERNRTSNNGPLKKKEDETLTQERGRSIDRFVRVFFLVLFCFVSGFILLVASWIVQFFVA